MTGYKSKRAAAQSKLVVTDIDGHVVRDARKPKKAQPAQEPVALVIDGVLVKSALPEKYTGHLYTTPPQRPWVYLTDEHIKEIVGPYGDMPIKGYTRKLVDQIEAKSKELNA